MSWSSRVSALGGADDRFSSRQRPARHLTGATDTSSRAQRGLRPALDALIDEGHDAWSVLEFGDRLVAQRERRAIAEAVDQPTRSRGATGKL